MPPKILERSRPATSILDFDSAGVIAFLTRKLEPKGVLEAYIFGSFATGNCTEWSDIDLVVVTLTDQPFLERPRQFDEIYELGIPIDLLVYTPEEFADLKGSGAPFWKEFDRQNIRII